MRYRLRPLVIRAFLVVALVISLPSPAARAEPPAAAIEGQPIPEGKPTRIECSHDGSGPILVSPGDKAQAGTFHYDVVLPSGYHAAADRRYPCLFIAGPAGSPGLGDFGNWVRSRGWIAILLVESRNGPWEPILGNFYAAHDDAIRRFRILEGWKFATGFSGGSRASSLFVQSRPGFGGLFLQGAGFAYRADRQGEYYTGELTKVPHLAVFGAFGNSDPNASEIERLQRALPKTIALRLETFEGRHVGPPRPLAEEGLAWLEARLWERLPATPERRTAAAQHLRDRITALESAAPYARWKALGELSVFAGRYGLKSGPGSIPEAAALDRTLAELRQDPTVQRELLAAQALARAEQSEANERRRGKLTDLASRSLARQYAEVSRQYPDTEAAATATQKAAVFGAAP